MQAFILFLFSVLGTHVHFAVVDSSWTLDVYGGLFDSDKETLVAVDLGVGRDSVVLVGVRVPWPVRYVVFDVIFLIVQCVILFGLKICVIIFGGRQIHF